VSFLSSISRHIIQIKQNLGQIMAVDQYYLSRELDIFAASKGKDEASSWKRLSSLRKTLDRSRQRCQRRTKSVPRLLFPEDLPISAKKDEIIARIKNDQVVIITGETGSGKTTQIPKMCLAAGLGLRGMIGHTQPRRIAATSIARRIADEVGESCGQSVAYKIRFEEETSAEPLIKVMTDGILLSETLGDPLLLAYDAIIIDEAHERSLNIDFLLGFLRTLLFKRKDLKLIITSATIDTAKFSQAFHNAPIIEVSGRMYPVNVRYQPIDSIEEENGERTYVDEAIACVERLQKERRYDDILIFMPTEQDIRETCERLAKRCSGLILPLYARLSGNRQRLVFEKIDQQKIIVATNIAETSLTIPGIKYVIDSGLARILEYNPRSQTTGLPIQPISRSSAEQRKGRCGRMQNGICIRLYSADEYAARPLYTVPEIMRSNLAGVILKMLSLNLGSVHNFPFIDCPHPKSIRDGIEILRDLGAIEKSRATGEVEEHELTAIGRTMARFPLDPRISRILIEAQKFDCINEIAIIAAALSISDPRERPYDRIDEAAVAHARFQNPESDFITYLTIWNQYHDTLEKLPTQSKIRKFCHEHYLSYRRMIEWRDIHHQILEIIGGTKKKTGSGKRIKVEIDQNVADKIHRSILSGYLSQIAQKKEKNFYHAAKSREVMVYPGSGLFNRGGNWIVATEITQTSRLFARNVANIKSEWLEEAGQGNCRYTYSAAHWEKSRGQVVAAEKVTLFGLTIIESRAVSYDRVDPEEAWRIFIREALVTGEVGRRIPFLTHNLAQIQKAQTLEEKLRKRGIAADEEAIAGLYEQTLPILSDIRSLMKLIKDRGSDEFLRFREDELIALEPDAAEIAKYPDRVKLGDAAFSCQYRFDPGRSDDGVTMKIPLGMISKAATENVERSLPNLLREKVLFLLKSLPKTTRQRLPAAAHVADLFVEQISDARQSLPLLLSCFLQDNFKVTVAQESWSLEKLPEHLNIRYSVVDEKGAEIKSSRDIDYLQRELADKVSLEAIDKMRDQWEEDNIRDWNFGALPEMIPLHSRHGLVGYAYPALQVNEDSISIRLFADQKQSERSHIQGVAALYEIYFADKLKQLKKNIALSGENKTMAQEIGKPALLEQSIMNRIKKDFFYLPWRSREDFFQHAEKMNNRILPYGRQILDAIRPVLKSFSATHEILGKLSGKNIGNKPALAFLAETRNDLQRMVPPNFSGIYSFDQLKELPRYLKALALRAERGSLNLAAARKKIMEIELYKNLLEELQKGIGPDTSDDKKEKIEEFFWMLEEYKVSLFAQELKTPYPVSPKKLKLLIKEIEETI
jgi:ATP-dependent helicase HrpA